MRITVLPVSGFSITGCPTPTVSPSWPVFLKSYPGFSVSSTPRKGAEQQPRAECDVMMKKSMSKNVAMLDAVSG